jgi:Flp pilus assembly pilin Flp
MRKFHTDVWGDERGTTAIEFAIVAPVFILLVIGILYLCMCLSVVNSMHYAVEEGARCASVRTPLQCTDNVTTIAYTQSRYYGPSSLPKFDYDSPAFAAACPNGHSVSGQLTYVVDLGLKQITVPISATACFPSLPKLPSP